MSSELTLEGVQYISSKRASEITGYSQDYVGQLARAGKILGKRVGGLWYIVAESLSKYAEAAEAYTPLPPLVEPPRSSEDFSIVTLEGKTYISAARAAKLTSYHQDYIGQLARAGKILSKQIGKRWYVDLEALKEHKKEKDALLGAVQASSVGLQTGDQRLESQKVVNIEKDPFDVGLHYTYKVETAPLIPTVPERKKVEEVQEVSNAEEKQRIPIRVVRPAISPKREVELGHSSGLDKFRETPVLSIFIKTFPIVLLLAAVFFVYNFTPPSISMSALKVAVNFEKVSISYPGFIEGFKNITSSLYSKRLYYTRD